MALKLPPSFSSDIEGRNTSIFPIVSIGTFASNYNEGLSNSWRNDSIHISTNSFRNVDFHTLPILSNIPSLKESIDIQERAYKISHMTISVSNAEYNGKRFSDIITEHPSISDSCIYPISVKYL